MVLTLRAGPLVLPQSLVCGVTFLASCCYKSVWVVLGGGNTEGGDGGVLSKSPLDGKHKVINLRPGWMAALFGEEIPWSLCDVSAGDGLIKRALPSE